MRYVRQSNRKIIDVEQEMYLFIPNRFERIIKIKFKYILTKTNVQ